MKTLDIGLDIDNVLYPWSTVFTRWTESYLRLEPGALDDHALTWSWYKDQWGMTTPEFLGIYAAGVRAGVIFTRGEPTPGSLSLARRLHLAGHRLHYVTDRELPNHGVSEAKAYAKTWTWLKRYGFPVDSLTVTGDKASVRTDVFLDDGPHNIEALVAARHPMPVLWNRPHNERVPVDAMRVSDFHHFEAIVSAMARGVLAGRSYREAA